MHPDHLSIMEAEYNRLSRRQDAEQHRLRVEAGAESNLLPVVGRVVTTAIGAVRRVLSTVNEMQSEQTSQGDVRSTDTMPAITSSM
ncbi:MAG: hypothetical protein JNL42_10190 [Anaerolineae bacterium]|nr:hypothetical protein [Anaerolineae bacterium]